jgi:hypothetical protein
MEAMEQVSSRKTEKNRYLKETTTLLYAFALAVPQPRSTQIQTTWAFSKLSKQPSSKTPKPNSAKPKT